MTTKRQRTVITIETIQRTIIRSSRGAKITRPERGENGAAKDFLAGSQKLRDRQRLTTADGAASVGSDDLQLVSNDPVADDTNK